MIGLSVIGLSLALLAASGSAVAGSAPHFSLPDLVTANGRSAFVFEGDRLSSAYPHLYQEYTPGDVTPDVLYDSYFGVVANGSGAWLTDARSVDYLPGTGIIAVQRNAPAGLGLAVTEYDFAPMGYAGVGVAQVLYVENIGATTLSGVQIVSLHNYHVGGSETVQSPDASHASESGSDVALNYSGPGASDVSCDDVYNRVLAGQAIGGGCGRSGDDVVPALGWRLEDLAPGDGVWIGVVTTDGDGDAWIAGRTAETWLTDEQADWASWQAENRVPDDLSDVERRVYEQQLAFLRMAQVTEPGDAYGQIPASLPVSAPVGDFEHIWNITWVRDGSYAAAALAAAGRTDEAAAALRFLAQGKTGAYRSYVGDANYLVSVCRVYGDGTEWSDSDENGPNVEFDDFGLYLWALGVLRDAGRADVVAELGPPALDGVADVLLGLIDPNTGLLQPDSSIWERHWNGQQQQFAYSSIQAVAGLTAAAGIADDLRDPRAASYRAGAAEIAAAIRLHLLSASGVIAASKDQLDIGSDYLDLAAVEAFNHEILEAGGREWDASLAAWDAGLRVASGNGYARNDDGSLYDQHEWAVIDLRLTEGLRRSCDLERARALEAWITDQAALNHNTIPELYDPSNANYAGPAPMLGFGAGAYVWGMLHRAELEAACDPDTAQVLGDDSGAPQAGCGCAAGAQRGASSLWIVLAALLWGRRRQVPG